MRFHPVWRDYPISTGDLQHYLDLPRIGFPSRLAGLSYFHHHVPGYAGRHPPPGFHPVWRDYPISTSLLVGDIDLRLFGSFHPVWRDYPISTATSCPLTSLSTSNLASEWPFLFLLRPKTRPTPRFSAYTDLQERLSDHCDDLPPFP